MLDDPHLSAATLTEILVFARSRPPLDELLEFFASRVPTLMDCDEVEVCPGPPSRGTAAGHDAPGRLHVSRHPVWCGRVPWGELHLTYRDGPPTLGEIHRGRLLAEVLGAALVSAGPQARAPVGADTDVAASAVDVGHPDPDDLVALVLGCAEVLDVMPDASTGARLALVVGRVAAAVGATSWSVGVTHHGRLYDVAYARVPGATDESVGDAATAAGPVVLSGFPARLRASEGGAFYADRCTGDGAERRALEEAGRSAVVGAGGYDLDGRSWVVSVLADTGARLEHVTPVLFALVLAALSFPREAVVPRPQDSWVRRVVDGSWLGPSAAEVRGIGATG